jgi:hypothetical protein
MSSDEFKQPILGNLEITRGFGGAVTNHIQDQAPLQLPLLPPQKKFTFNMSLFCSQSECFSLTAVEVCTKCPTESRFLHAIRLCSTSFAHLSFLGM